MALSRQEKLEYAHAMLRKTAQEVSRNTDNWRMFLRSAANVYKYNFTEQLLIYAQKPDAVACAEFDLWSKRMNRYVNRGTRGIILLNDERNKERLRYVFDVSDTHPARDAKSRMPHQWKITEDNQSFVISQLAERFDIRNTESIEQALHEAAVSVVNESLPDIADELPVYDSFLEGLDKANIEKEIRDTAISSVEYLLLVKCGLNADENIAPEDFSYICDFNTMDSLCVIGSAVSDVSEQILRTAERAAKKFELQQKQKLFNQLSEKGRLVADAKEAKAAAEQLNENRSRQREQTTDAQRNFPSRGTQMSLFDEPDKQEQPKNIINQAAVDAALRRGSNFEYGKHRIYDHYQKNTAISETIDFLKKEYGTGGSNDVMEGSGIDEFHDAKGIKLTRGENELLISWNSAAVRIGELIQQDRYFTPEEKAFHELYAIREKAAEEFLKTGGYNRDSIMNICIEFSKGNSIYENANFLRNEFKGVNKGLTIDGVDIAFSYSDNFIRYTVGDSTYDRDRVCEFVSWEQAAELVQTMLEEGRFAPPEILDNMHGFELERASHSFWYMAKNLNYDSYPELRDVFDSAWLEGGFPDSTARIARMLEDPAKRADLIYTAMVLSERYAEDKNVMRFRMYEPPDVLQQLTDLNLEREQFTAGYYENTAKQFITQDEITAEFVGRDEYNQTKTQIYLFFKEHTDNKERADYLKELFGTGGRDGRGLTVSYNNKGVSFKRMNAEPVTYSWQDMTVRIGRLIDENQYMTERQLAEDVTRYQTEQEQQKIQRDNYTTLRDMNRLSPEERQASLAHRISLFIGIADNREKGYFADYGIENLLTETEAGIDEAIRNSETRQRLADCMQKIGGATADVVIRNCGYGFAEELRELKIADRQRTVEHETEITNNEQEQAEGLLQYLSWYREYSNIKAEHENEIVFYRVGDFYEMFGDDAVHAAEVLQLNMTGRDNGVERVPMCGIPVHAAEDYINRLTSHGLSVAVADVDGDVHSVTRSIMPEPVDEAENDTDDAEQEEQPEQEQTTDISQPILQNFRITDEHLGAGGPKTKFKNNIDAIKTLQLIERENRYAHLQNRRLCPGMSAGEACQRLLIRITAAGAMNMRS